jgi:hypothetical protein
MKIDVAALLSDLEAEVDTAKKAYEESKIALDVFKRKFGASAPLHSSVSSEKQAITISGSGQIDLSEMKLDEPKKTLPDTVLEIISRFGDQEFTVGHVYNILEKMDEVPKVKSPKASIAQALSVLEGKGEVIRTLRGSGNIPHRFKLAKDSKENSPDEETSGLFNNQPVSETAHN